MTSRARTTPSRRRQASDRTYIHQLSLHHQDLNNFSESMRTRLKYAAALLTLLFVGGGCAAQKMVEVGAPAPKPQSAMEAKTEVKAEGSVDGTADAILKDLDQEQEALTEQEGDASEADSDKAALNAYSEGSYEVK